MRTTGAMTFFRLTALALVAALLIASAPARADNGVSFPLPDGSSLPSAAPAGFAPLQGAMPVTLKKSFTATIASGQTTSGAIDLGTARLWALVTPTILTATSVTFLASPDCSVYSALYDSTGTAVSWTVATSRYIVNANAAQWLSVRCLKLAIGASEGADRVFTIEAVP